MPNCTCPNICSCFMSEDGFFSGHPETGRNNTQVEGSGTLNDPFIVTFLDSVNFRPRAGELRPLDQTKLSGGSGLLDVNSSIRVYETPAKIFLFFGFKGILLEGQYWVIGASAEFGLNAVGRRHLFIQANETVLGTIQVAGVTSAGSSQEGLTLSCSGYNPGLFAPLGSLGTNSIMQEFQVGVIQNSGATLDLRKLKFWATAI